VTDRIRIEIPVVVARRGGYLALEVDTAHPARANCPPPNAKEAARALASDEDYVGTPYVVVAYLPAFEAQEIDGEVEPC
jgi:hypothetical protein